MTCTDIFQTVKPALYYSCLSSPAIFYLHC